MQFEPLPPVPAVTLARQLRQIPLFRFASVDELFRISTIAQQVRYEAGTNVQQRGDQAVYIQVLLEGSFELNEPNGTTRVVEPPGMLGFQEVLEGTTLQSEARALSESVALVMPAEEFRTLLSANIELAQGLFRLLLERGDPDGLPVPSRSVVSRRAPIPSEPLKIVDKVLHLQTIPMFARASADELYALAAITREVEFGSDELLFSEGHPAAIWLVLSGEIALESMDGKSSSIGAGDCIGLEQTLAGIDWSWHGRTDNSGRALQVEHDALFELLADRIDLLQSVFGAVFYERRPEAVQEGIESG